VYNDRMRHLEHHLTFKDLFKQLKKEDYKIIKLSFIPLSIFLSYSLKRQYFDIGWILVLLMIPGYAIVYLRLKHESRLQKKLYNTRFDRLISYYCDKYGAETINVDAFRDLFEKVERTYEIVIDSLFMDEN